MTKYKLINYHTGETIRDGFTSEAEAKKYCADLRAQAVRDNDSGESMGALVVVDGGGRSISKATAWEMLTGRLPYVGDIMCYEYDSEETEEEDEGGEIISAQYWTGISAEDVDGMTHDEWLSLDWVTFEIWG